MAEDVSIEIPEKNKKTVRIEPTISSLDIEFSTAGEPVIGSLEGIDVSTPNEPILGL
tara:strand:- start:606250 stop:606420 length:171 start_codon:yes stop_codon:yes gene_type:complete